MIMLTNMILNYFLAYKINKILRHVTFNFNIKENTMKETRNLNISFCQNGKSNQQTGRLVLPTNWLRLLGITESFKKVEVTYEDGSITIKKGYQLPYLLANQGHVIAATVTNNAKIHIDTHGFFGINLHTFVRAELDKLIMNNETIAISDRDYKEIIYLIIKDLKENFIVKENNRHFQPVNGKVYCLNCTTVLLKR